MKSSGQSYKASTIVIYDSRVVNYERKLFIRLATVCITLIRFEEYKIVMGGAIAQ